MSTSAESTRSLPRAKGSTLSIDSAAALVRLRRSLWLPQRTRPGTRIVLDERALGADAKRAEKRVNQLYANCGCTAGKLALLGTLAWLGARYLRGDLVLDRRDTLLALGSIVASAVVGKLVGIAWSRVRLASLLRRLERRLTPT